MPDLSIIPAHALQDPELTGTDIRVLCAIGIHTDGRNGTGCFARARTLCEEARVSRNQFFASTKKLLERGYIERHSGQATGTVSAYAIRIPSLAEKIGGVPKNGTGETSKTLRGSPRIPDGSTINAPTNAASFRLLNHDWKHEDARLVLEFMERVPEPRSWLAEIQAMLDGMGGHVHASTSQIARAVHDYTANGKIQEPSLRQFRRYVKDATEADPETENKDLFTKVSAFWDLIIERGTLNAQTKESALFDFAEEPRALNLCGSADAALELFIHLDRRMLRSATKESAIKHIIKTMRSK